MSDVVVYTDGACSGNPGPGGWAALVVSRSQQRFWELGGRVEQTTNNIMEMTAVARALDFVLQNSDLGQSVEVLTDSSYVLKGATEWIFGWKRRAWTKADGSPVANVEHWVRLDALVQRLGSRLRWNLVPGHAGIPGNEWVDKLSVAFSQSDQCQELRSGNLSDLGFDPLASVVLRTSLGSKLKQPVYLSFVNGKLERHATWQSCEARVRGVAGAKFKKIEREGEESTILATWGVSKQA